MEKLHWLLALMLSGVLLTLLLLYLFTGPGMSAMLFFLLLAALFLVVVAGFVVGISCVIDFSKKEPKK